MPLGLYLDLAVGARVGGAESWGQEAVAEGVSLGAPPDHLSPAGQNWHLTAFAPRKLQQQRYAALRHILRASMRHCGLLRIDHALGLNRSYWIPDDGSSGGYIAQNMQAMMAIIAIEAARASTVIVGEDLGLVPAGFRDTMAARGFYGYSVLQYEKDSTGAFLPAETLRSQSLACFGTHDTPTLAGFWEGRDISWWEKLGWITPDAAGKAMTTRMSEKRALTDIRAPAPLPKSATPGVRDTLHTRLATSPAALVAVQLDDMLLVKEAQNLPGTIDAHPNWRRRTPLTVPEISASPDISKTAAIMARAGRASRMRKEST
jgi:4-alpha-glucanotransferase